jgi:hypothetical protein
MDARWDEDQRLAAMDALERLAAMDERITAMDERWDIKLESLGHRLTATFERGIADAVTSQTRTLVFSQLAALVVIAGLAFGSAVTGERRAERAHTVGLRPPPVEDTEGSPFQSDDTLPMASRRGGFDGQGWCSERSAVRGRQEMRRGVAVACYEPGNLRR